MSKYGHKETMKVNTNNDFVWRPKDYKNTETRPNLEAAERRRASFLRSNQNAFFFMATQPEAHFCGQKLLDDGQRRGGDGFPLLMNTQIKYIPASDLFKCYALLLSTYRVTMTKRERKNVAKKLNTIYLLSIVLCSLPFWA